MKQAELLIAVEHERLPALITSVGHSEKNRLAVMLGPLPGPCVGQIAALTISDHVNGAGKTRPE